MNFFTVLVDNYYDTDSFEEGTSAKELFTYSESHNEEIDAFTTENPDGVEHVSQPVQDELNSVYLKELNQLNDIFALFNSVVQLQGELADSLKENDTVSSDSNEEVEVLDKEDVEAGKWQQVYILILLLNLLIAYTAILIQACEFFYRQFKRF